jgi:hypothetical protein
LLRFLSRLLNFLPKFWIDLFILTVYLNPLGEKRACFKKNSLHFNHFSVFSHLRGVGFREVIFPCFIIFVVFLSCNLGICLDGCSFQFYFGSLLTEKPSLEGSKPNSREDKMNNNNNGTKTNQR